MARKVATTFTFEPRFGDDGQIDRVYVRAGTPDQKSALDGALPLVGVLYMDAAMWTEFEQQHFVSGQVAA